MSAGCSIPSVLSVLTIVERSGRPRRASTRGVVQALVVSKAVRSVGEEANMAAASNEGREDKGMELLPPGLRASSKELEKIEVALQEWAVTRHRATPEVVCKVKSCLREDFLLGLAQPNANHYWPDAPDGRSWRYLFRRQCFRVLGVHERIPEGHPDGLPTVVNEFLRTKWWPSRVEGDPVASVNPFAQRSVVTGGRSGGKISHGRVRRATTPYAIQQQGRNSGLPSSTANAATCPNLSGTSDSP